MGGDTPAARANAAANAFDLAPLANALPSPVPAVDLVLVPEVVATWPHLTLESVAAAAPYPVSSSTWYAADGQEQTACCFEGPMALDPARWMASIHAIRCILVPLRDVTKTAHVHCSQDAASGTIRLSVLYR